MRAFLGIKVSGELRPKIVTLQQRLSNLDIKLVEPQNLHFNLKFFGDIERQQVESLEKSLRSAFKDFAPFEIEIKGIGAFPSNDYVRVLWLGVGNGRQNLVSLADSVQEAMEGMGFSKESFVPHLTLGRVRSARNKDSIRKILEEMKDVEIGRMRVEKISLFESELGTSGPVYKEVFCIAF